MRWKPWVVMVGLSACGGRTEEVPQGSGGGPARGNGGQGGTSYVPPYPDYCFGKGTQIATATGSIAIEELRAGDRVQGFDLATGVVVERPVTEVFVHEGQRVGVLQTALGPLRVTANHPIYDAASNGFVAAGSLGERFETLELSSNWSAAPSTLAGFSQLDDSETVYNLTVAGVHTYFANGLLVHNKSRCGYPGDPPDCPCIPNDDDTRCTGGIGGIGGTGFTPGGSGAGGVAGGSGAPASAGFGGIVGGSGESGEPNGDAGAGGAIETNAGGQGGAGELD